MSNELTKVEITDVALSNDELINQANSGAGVSVYASMPKIPTLKINNKAEEKEVQIEDKIQKVKFINPGFLVTEKADDGKYKTIFFSKALEGVVLKRRYKISSKINTEPRYWSEEFDTWQEKFKVFTGANEMIFEGNYAESKEMFQTGINARTKRMDKSFDTFLVLYLNIENKLYKFEWKMSGKNKWFDYEAEFKEDTFVRYKTQFVLHEETTGDIDYYYVEFKKGEEINLAEQLEYQKQLNGFLGIKKAHKTIANQAKDQADDFFAQPEQSHEPVIHEGEIIDEEEPFGRVPTESIPF